MFRDILRSIRDNIKRFAVVWLLILFANQIFVFGACFAPYCLAAAAPHTLVFAALINFFVLPAQSSKPAAPRARTPPKPSNQDAFRGGDKRKFLVSLLALAAVGLVVTFFVLKRSEPALEPIAAHHPALSAGPADDSSPTGSAAPPAGRELALSEQQLRYCVAQGIRLEGIRELAVLDTLGKRTRFNAMLADYDTRCAAHLSPSNALDAAIIAVEPYRRALKFEGLRAISDAEIGR